jgi:hypothetical protein
MTLDPQDLDPHAVLSTLDPAAGLALPGESPHVALADLDPGVVLPDPAAPGFIEVALPGTDLPWDTAAPGLLDGTDTGPFAHLQHQPDGLTFGGWCGCNQCSCASFSGRGDICDNCHHSRGSHYY